MKRLIFLFFFGLCVAHTSTAQVKIGDNPQNIDASSVLELESTDKVLVITRVTTAQMNSISPLQGALVYNTDLQGVHYYDGTQWVNIGGGGGTGGPLTADAIVNAGGDPTIVITPTATGDNLEVAPNSISTAQIAPFGINGTTDIQPESIGVGKLAGDVITEFELSENSVGPLQIQNQNIDLGDFNNVAGFITAADVVSADAGNVIESRADGVYYNDDQLIMDIADTDQKIDDHIAADLDTSLVNEIQDLTITGNTITLSKPTGGDDVITLPSTTGEIDDNELITGAVLTGTDLVITEAGTDFTIPLASLSGGDATVINSTATVTVLGTGTTGDPFELTAVGGGGGGTTEVVDGTLLIGTGAAASPFTINPGGPDQILRTNAAGDALAWVDLPAGSGDDNQTAAEVPFTATTNTTSTDVQAAIEELQTDIDGFSATSGQSNTASNQGGAGIGLVLPKNVLDLPFKSINASTSGIISVIDDLTNFEVDLDITDNSITLDKIAPNGATADGEILQWNTDIDGLGVGNAGWEVAANAGHTGDPKSIFFGDADGVPTQFNHPGTDRPSLYWDYEGRTLSGISYGALAIGVDGEAQEGVLPELSNEVKVHIAEKLSNRVSYSLLLQNSWDEVGATSGSGVGMLFASDRYNDGKGALVFERRDNWGVGDFHFLQNNEGEQKAPVLATDKAFTITRDKNIVLYGDLFDKNDDFVTATPVGHVLTNTINGTEWAPAGGLPTATADGQIITWDADAINPTTGGYVVTSPQAIALDAANDQIDITQTIGTATNVTSSVSLDATTLEVFDNGTATDATDDVIQVKDAGITAAKIAPATALPTPAKQILVTNTAGTLVGWEPLTSTGSQNLATDNLTQDAEDRTYNLNGQTLVFNSSVPGGNIGIGTFDNDPLTTAIPALSTDKLDVNGQIRARDGFAASPGTANLPSYGFYTDGDNDTGMYRQGPDQIAFSAGGQKTLSLEYDGTDREAIFTSQVSLTEELLDKDGEAGLPNQVLSSTGADVDWVLPNGGLIQKGKAVTGAGGTATITIPVQPTFDYVINLTVRGVTSTTPYIIQISDQQINNFTAQVFELDPSGSGAFSAISGATFHYTVYQE